jgi:hypothetical protein
LPAKVVTNLALEQLLMALFEAGINFHLYKMCWFNVLNVNKIS